LVASAEPASSRSALWWAKAGPLAQVLARLQPFRQPPVLVLSLARSGSSWVGDVLGNAAGAAYLREPVTQTHRPSGGRFGLFELAPGQAIPAAYLAARQKMIAGVPNFVPRIVRNPGQWSLRSRSTRTLVVKEVNPLATDFLLEGWRPRVVYLTRHPVAVARSYFAQNWTGSVLADRVSKQTMAEIGAWPPPPLGESFWFNHGALHAVAHRRALSALRNYPDWCLVRYEDLCINPLQEFARLFDFCGLEFDDGSKARIVDSASSTEAYSPGQYSLRRNSREMVDAWHSAVAASDIEEVRQGYFVFPPAVYGDDRDWNVATTSAPL
jgi:hypothetical protein